MLSPLRVHDNLVMAKTYCSKSIFNIISVVSGGKLLKNKILLGILEPIIKHVIYLWTSVNGD